MGSEAGHLQGQKAPCVDDKISVTPLVIPVSVPVSERTQVPADRPSHDPGSLAISAINQEFLCNKHNIQYCSQMHRTQEDIW